MFKKNVSTIALVNIVLYVLTVGINYLGATGFFNGLDQKMVSDKYMTLITPAPITFSIWGVIYLLLLITLVTFFIKRNEKQTSEIIEVTAPYLWLNFLLNAIWIVLFSYEQLVFSSIVIIGIMLTLIKINLKLHNYWYHNIRISGLAFGIYGGWVTVATVINISAAFIQFNFSGWGLGLVFWTLLTVVIALVIITYIANQLKNIGFTLAAAWAFFGIHLAHQSEVIFNRAYPILNIIFVPVAIYFLILSLIIYWHNNFRITLSR